MPIEIMYGSPNSPDYTHSRAQDSITQPARGGIPACAWDHGPQIRPAKGLLWHTSTWQTLQRGRFGLAALLCCSKRCRKEATQTLDRPLPYQKESLSMYLTYTGCANTQMQLCRPFDCLKLCPTGIRLLTNSKGNTQQSSQSNQQPILVNLSSSQPGSTLQCERTQPRYLHPMVSH